MDRRTFLATGLAVASVPGFGAAGVGRAQPGAGTVKDDVPAYSEWVPASQRSGVPGALFSHLNWKTLSAIDSEMAPGPNGQGPAADGTNLEDLPPIVALPILGSTASSIGLVGLLGYPFAMDLLPALGTGQSGPTELAASTSTWTGEEFVFHGAFDAATFEERYAEGFDAEGDRDGYTVFVGTDEVTEGLAYAVSAETLVVGVPSKSGARAVADALDRRLGGEGRVIDTDEGRWLFERTGGADVAVGGWQLDDLRATVEAMPGGSMGGMAGRVSTSDDPPGHPGDPPTSNESQGHSGEPSDEPGREDAGGSGRPGPAVGRTDGPLGAVESFANALSIAPEDGVIDARFAGIYPEDAVPTAEAVREDVIGTSAVPHDIAVEGRRVYATATVESMPGEGV